MTTTDTPEQPTILTTSVEVPDIGTVDEARAHELNADALKATLKVLGIRAPASARKAQLLEWTINGLRLQAMADAQAPIAAIGPGPTEPEEAIPAGTLEAQRPAGGLPSLTRWQHLTAMAEYLAKSSFTPDALRGKPHDVGAILLMANDLGVAPSTALAQFYVVHGKVGMEAKLMRALVRRDGHSIGPIASPDPDYVAYYTGTRADTGDTYTAEFSLDDAWEQDLIAGYDRNEDGSITVKPKLINNKSVKPQWVKQTRTMLKERACSGLCRELFSDCLAGISYVPEELGYIDVEEEPGPRGRAGETEPTMTLNQQISEIAARIEELPDDLKAELRVAWKARNLPKPADLRPAAIRQARALLEPIEAKAAERQAAADAEIPDADLVDDGPSVGDAGEPGPVSPGGDGTQDPVTASPAPDDITDAEVICSACGEPVKPEHTLVWSDDEQPYHVDCAPFT